MRQEYLFSNKEKIEELKAYQADGIQVDVIEVQDTDAVIFALSINSNSFDSAKTLSNKNLEIINKYKPTVLLDESSEYFNKNLYPLANEFERKLRKLLYLSSILHKEESDCKNIDNLEQKDFGTIFNLLFTDIKFINAVKAVINDKTWQYTQKEILDSIKSIKENTLWDKIISKSTVPTLRESFLEVKQYRNDIMHAHNINFETFDKAKKLFKKINSELDIAIQELDGIDRESFNKDLSEAMQEQEKELLFRIPTPLDLRLSNSGILANNILSPDFGLANPLLKISTMGDIISPQLTAYEELNKTMQLSKGLGIEPMYRIGEKLGTISPIESLIKPRYSPTLTSELKDEKEQEKND